MFVLFFFTAVVDFFVANNPARKLPFSVLEESGERFVLTLTVSYAVGLATSWTGEMRRRSV